MIKRPRRLRHNLAMREMVRETTLERRNLVYPLFVVEGENIKEEISSLKGIFHFSLDRLEEEIKELVNLGIQYVILFGIPNEKDAFGKEAYSETGIVQEAIRKVKEIAPDMYVITDVCMCQYTDHGHCGILNKEGYKVSSKDFFRIGIPFTLIAVFSGYIVTWLIWG